MENSFGINIIPEHDMERIEVLRRYKILNTPPEERFDHVASLASQIFKVPIALVSLVDADQVYYKANVGMGTETSASRGMSLCALAVLSREVTVFENAAEEPGLLSNANVGGDFGLKFYAAAPITTHDGFHIGTLCIMDKVPRTFTDSDRQILAGLSKIVMDEMELRLSSIQEVEKQQEYLEEAAVVNEELVTINEELQASYEELSSTNEDLRHSKNTLAELKDNLEQIINMLPASVVIIRGYDLIVEMINTSNLEYWDKTKEEVLSRPFLEILPDLADQPFASQLRRVMETGEIIDVKESPVLFTSEDGSTRETYVDYTYQPLCDNSGNRTGVLVMSFEITDRVLAKRLLETYAKELSATNAELTISNEKLALSEARFKYLIQEAPVAIGVLNQRALIIESANAKILEGWGKTSAIVGMPLSVALPELHDQSFLEILDQVYTTAQPFHANESRALLEHDGELTELFFNVTYQPIVDSSGSTSDILVVAVDVTEQVNSRLKVEESEKHFRYLADLVPSKISNATPGGAATFFNKQWLDFAGMEFEDLKDRGYQRLIHPEDLSDFKKSYLEATINGKTFASEMRFRNREGKFIWHLNTASPILDENGNVTMWVSSATDIHLLKEEEHRKHDFVTMLSHELKTPLTSIKGHVQLLLRGLDSESGASLPTKLRPSLSRIDKLLLQLTGLIGDMLNMKRVEAGRLELRKEQFPLDVLIAEVVADFQLSHQEHHFNLNLETGTNVYADRHKISQVMINLVANAIKYAPHSQELNISLRKAADEAIITVQDYGIGIDEKDQTKIFERFYRVEGQSELQYSGLGIGLYLVKSIIDFHGGKIRLESSKGHGSTFIIHLPPG
jgi:PAS domain S-box-containing protein